jgi:SAM-dependent methyltransferase
MKFYQFDVRNAPFPNSFFDQIVAVSTIEHVGQEEVPDNGDIVAMGELSRILKERGKMLITFPFASKYSLKRGRNYDEKRLRLLIGDLSIEKEDYCVCCGKGKCVKASKEEAEASFAPSRPMAVVCLVLRKKAQDDTRTTDI